MIKEKYKKYFLILLSLLIFSGCSSGPITKLTSDSPASEKDKSTLLLKVKITSKSPEFIKLFYDKMGVLPIIGFKRIKKNKSDSHIILIPSNLSILAREPPKYNLWEEKGNIYTLDENIYISAEPGDYLLNDLHLYLGSETSYSYKSQTTTSYIHYFYMNTGFTVPNHGVYTLGTLYFNIEDFSGKWPNYTFKYFLYQDQNKKDLKNLEADFHTKYPKISLSSEKLIEVLPLYYRYVCTFSDSKGAQWKRLWGVKRTGTVDFFISFNDKYTIKKEVSDNLVNYISIKKRLSLSRNYNIEWKSRLAAGENEKGFGLIFGKDARNCYYFTTTGIGKTAVINFQNGKWRNRPLNYGEINAYSSSVEIENCYRIENRNGSLKYYINNRLLCEFKSVYDVKRPYFAFFISGKGIVIYDDFIITGMDRP